MNFAIVEDCVVVNVAVSDSPLADNWIELPDGAGIGWSYIDGEFVDLRPDPEPTPVAAPTKEELLAQLQALQAQITALGE